LSGRFVLRDDTGGAAPRRDDADGSRALLLLDRAALLRLGGFRASTNSEEFSNHVPKQMNDTRRDKIAIAAVADVFDAVVELERSFIIVSLVLICNGMNSYRNGQKFQSKLRYGHHPSLSLSCS
jgi:hypothetical protein